MGMKMNEILKKNKGITLIELLVALVISGLLVAALYRTFIGQQRTYVAQDQVVDMQQNMRVAISRMMGDIRMTGFGNVSTVLPVTFTGGTFNNILNPNTPVSDSLTLVTSLNTPATLTTSGSIGQNQIVVFTLTDSQGNALFDTGNRRYISVGGLESYIITSVDNGTSTITLNGSLTYNHPIGTPVFTIRAITYQVADMAGIPTLLRNENIGDGNQPQADYIENLQFAYFDDSGIQTANPLNMRLVQVTLTARTGSQDPELARVGDGFRRRQIASNIHLRNMGI